MNHIAAYRTLYGLSQRELADALGYDSPSRATIISAWECGRVRPPMWAVDQMAELFDVPWVRLYDGPPPTDPVPGQADRIREKLEELEKRKKPRRVPSRRTR